MDNAPAEHRRSIHGDAVDQRIADGSLDDLLGLTRMLAEKLSDAAHLGRGSDDFRLAQALSLNVLDLLETTRGT